MSKDGHPHTEDIMPDIFRPPEVVMRMAWDEKVDIWSIAPLVWKSSCHFQFSWHVYLLT